MGKTLVLLSVLALHQDSAPTPVENAQAQPATFSGCVTPLPQIVDTYVLAAADRCYLLRGSFSSAAIAGHEVVLQGTFLPAAHMNPDTIQVQSTTSVGSACTRTCTLEPPNNRGVRGKEKPGRQGGTPGVVPDASGPR